LSVPWLATPGREAFFELAHPAHKAAATTSAIK